MPDDSPMTECPQGGGMPPTDPTVLTTEALQRAINSLHDIISREATHESESRVAADVSLRSLCDEKFEAVAREMKLVEDSRVEQKQDALASLAAALSAAKEAVKEQTTASALSINKSENATNEQLKQLNATFTLAIEGVNSTITDLKERFNRVEQAVATHAAAGSEKEKATDKIQPWVFAIIMAVVAVASIIIQLSH